MLPRVSASALDALEGIPQRLRHRPPLLTPYAVVTALVILVVEDPSPTTSHNLPHGAQVVLGRLVGAGQVGRKRSRRPRPLR